MQQAETAWDWNPGRAVRMCGLEVSGQDLSFSEPSYRYACCLLACLSLIFLSLGFVGLIATALGSPAAASDCFSSPCSSRRGWFQFACVFSSSLRVIILFPFSSSFNTQNPQLSGTIHHPTAWNRNKRIQAHIISDHLILCCRKRIQSPAFLFGN